jgi:hypothetical protein
VKVVEDVFVLAAPGRRGAAGLVGVSRVAGQALGAYFHGRFSRRPERAVSVYLFPSAAPYDAYCRGRWQERCSSSYGFYLGDERRIVMNAGPGVGTLTHELVHPILEADFPAAPDWLEEGIASLYEGFALGRPGDIRGVKNWRHPRLLAALGSPRERDEVRIERLFGMRDQVFRNEREDLHYALARYFCLWLDEQALLWPFYQRWRDHVAEDPTGSQAFVAVVGRLPAEATAAWIRWVRAL